MRTVALNFCLWIGVVTLAVAVGGNLFQAFVVDPVWSGSPPDSVRAFRESPLLKRVARFHLNPFYFLGLLALLASPFLAWGQIAMRNWLLLTLGIQLVILLGTVLFFYPINNALVGPGAEATDAASVRGLVRRWIRVDRLRFALRVAAFLCLLQAFRLSAVGGG